VVPGEAALSVGCGAEMLSGHAAKRILSGALLVPLFVALVYAGPPWLFVAFLLLVSGLAQWEFTRMFRRAGEAPYARLGLGLGLAVTASFVWHAESVTTLAMASAILVTLAAPLASGRAPAWAPSALTLLGVCYVNWSLGYGVWLRDLPHGAHWIIFLVTVTWVGETTAYAVGSLIGRHKLAPVVSPAKTIEGAIAQVIASVASAVVVNWALFPDRAPVFAAAGGLLLGVVGQLGDLSESVLKRSVGTKDTGGLIPGHGGLLDRLDSLLFNTPALYYYARYVAGGTA
jgi:phosphatidate cytidylyltransferase